MAEGKLEPESSGRAPGAEETGKVEINDLTTGLIDPIKAGRDQIKIDYGSRIADITGTVHVLPGMYTRYPASGSIVDATGNPVSIANMADIAQAAAQADNVIFSLRKEEFERLNVKTTEVLNQTALAYERIAKDREEIEQLKTETRAMLARLHAA
jgi:RPA family protein